MNFAPAFSYRGKVRDVAQLVSVHVWGACGRQFESGHPDKNTFTMYDATSGSIPPRTYIVNAEKQEKRSGCSAVGSALRSGRRGRAFESPHPDFIKSLKR